MGAFKFRLQAVMKVRKEARDQARYELARALRAETILKTQQENGQREVNKLLLELAKAQTRGEISVDWIMELRRYEVVLKTQLAQVMEQMEQIGVEVERRRDLLARADREVRVLERLEAKQKSEWTKREQRLEQFENDEAAGQIFFLRRVEGVESI